MKTLRALLLFAFALSSRAADLRFELEPADQAVLPGQTVTFESRAVSAEAVSYQWFKGNFAIPGETGANLSFRVIDSQDGGAYRVRATAGSDILFSREAILTVLVQPTISITSPAANVQYGAGEIRFAVTFESPTSTAARVQYFNGNNLLATATEPPFDATLTLPLGQYNLRAVLTTVHNTTATSAIVPFTIVHDAPVITLEPLDQRVFAGRVVELRGAAAGAEPLAYRWTRNNTPIEGATSSVLSFTVSGPAQEGEYRFIASNDFGSATSSAATVSIASAGPNFMGRFKHSIVTFPVDSYNTMAAGNGLIMVAGATGLVVTSSDGVNWEETSPPYTDNFLRVRFLNGKFWLLSDRGTIVTTADARVWNRINANIGGAALRDIAYFNGAYIAVGAFGRIVRSVDGVTWTQRIFGDTPFVRIAAGANAVVVISSRGMQEVYHSVDGVAWTTPRVEDSASESYDAHYFSGRFVVTRQSGIFTSADGLTWTFANAGRYQVGIASPARLMLYSAERRAARSENGIDFAQDPAFTQHNITAGVYAGIYYFTGPNSYLAGSVNGVSMSVLGAGYTIPAVVPRISFAGENFYITGLGASVIVSDGSEGWAGRANMTGNTGTEFSGVAYGEGGYVASAFNRLSAWLSENGVNFSPSATPAPTISILKFQDGEYLGVNGTDVRRSSDGRAWTSHYLGAGVALGNIARAGGKTVAVGRDGKVFLSENGNPFEAIAPITTKYLQGAAYGLGLFVAVGKDGFAMHSPDGRQWFEGKRNTAREITDVAFAEGMFVATVNGGQILYSLDGVNWEAEQLHSAQDLFSINHGNGRWVVGGRNGLLMQTAPRPLSQPQIAAAFEGGELLVTVIGEAGDVLRLESAATPDAATWEPIETITLSGSPTLRRFAVAGEAGFIRLVRAP